MIFFHRIHVSNVVFLYMIKVLPTSLVSYLWKLFFHNLQLIYKKILNLLSCIYKRWQSKLKYILYCLLHGYIQKAKLFGQIFTSNDVSNNVNLNKILKSKEVRSYYNISKWFKLILKRCFRNDYTIWSSIFLVTFTTCVNNWPIFVKTLKDLHIEHVQNLHIENKYLSNIKDLVKNDSITCVRYYEHRINCFQKLFNSNNLLLDEINDLFYNKFSIHRFSPRSWIVMV